MRYDANKAFPHPVLRPLIDGGQSSDFPGYGFQTTVAPRVSPDGSNIELEVRFDITQPDIVRAVEGGQARFSVLAYCSTTYYRMHFGSAEPHLVATIPAGHVDRTVEVRPSIVVTTEMDRYRPTGLHDELASRMFHVQAGGLLAQDHTVRFPASREFLGPITSIFQISPDPNQPRGKFDIRFGDPVQIVVHPDDNLKLAVARHMSEKRSVIMNSVYLPAVIALLGEAVQYGPDGTDERWYEVVRFKMDSVELDWEELLEGRINLWSAAQMLLDQPSRHLDFMKDEDAS